jgi:hypothetical protein
MWKPITKEFGGKRVCALCGSIGYYPFGIYDFHQSRLIGWVCSIESQRYISKNLGANMKIKDAAKEREWLCVTETVKDQLFKFLQSEVRKDKEGKDCRLFDKPFKELERDDAIKLVYCILNGYRDNLNKRIKYDEVQEGRAVLAKSFWGPDDDIPWMKDENYFDKQK